MSVADQQPRTRRVLVALVALVAAGLPGCLGCSEEPVFTPEAPSIAPIVIDGDLGDWSLRTVTTLGEDPIGDGLDKDLAPRAIRLAQDLIRVDAGNDRDRLLLRLAFAESLPDTGAVDYAIFLDSDLDSTTGYAIGSVDPIGSDFIVMGGRLLKHTSTSAIDWVWDERPLAVSDMVGEDSIEISINLEALGLKADGSEIAIIVAAIDANDRSRWEDDIKDFFPEANGKITRAQYTLAQAEDSLAMDPSEGRSVEGIENYLLYYGAWDQAIVARAVDYHLIVLDAHRGPPLSRQRPIVRRLRAGRNGLLGDDDDAIVLGYISLGEDVRTFGNQPAIVGDGRGPAEWDDERQELRYQERGVAGYYLDEKIADGTFAFGHDGESDRHGTWGACYVNPGDPAWQDFILGVDGRQNIPYSAGFLIEGLGYDGLFLDTPEVAGPWHGHGFTARGLFELIRRLDETFTDAVLLLNRGVFFLVPDYPYQYRWSPREHIDIMLFESHHLDSDYHLDDSAYHRSPFLDLNRNFFDPKVQAEFGRTDSLRLLLSVDYAADPDRFADDHPDMFLEVLRSSILDYGRIELITNRWVDALPRLLVDRKPPADQAAPTWSNTSAGLVFHGNPVPTYMARGSENSEAKPPRIGVGTAIPGDGVVTLRWDVATDQTPTVRYHIYYSDRSPIDFETSAKHLDVAAQIPDEYRAERSGAGTDSAYPYEYTVTGLSNGTTYYFAVRAEDSTVAVDVPATGHRGPSGGIEDTNTVEVAAAPKPAF